jgi:signal transduction histidine kinase
MRWKHSTYDYSFLIGGVSVTVAKFPGILGLINLGDSFINHELVGLCETVSARMGFGFIPIEYPLSRFARSRYEPLEKLMQCTCFVVNYVDVTNDDVNEILEVLQNSGRPLFVMRPEELRVSKSIKFSYKYSNESLSDLRDVYLSVERWLRKIDKTPSPRIAYDPSLLDIERLDPRDFENMCFELLQRAGFQRISWASMGEADMVGTVSKKDPDGFQYDEIWFVFLGRKSREVYQYTDDPAFVQHLLETSDFKRNKRMDPEQAPITLLLVPQDDGFGLGKRRRNNNLIMRLSLGHHRVRIWDNGALATLLGQNPGLVYKYFLNGRNASTYRKNYEELYRENMLLNDKLQANIERLREEQQLRIAAERNSIWKDVALKAAHKIGNPIYQADNWLFTLRKHVNESGDILVENLQSALEKAKSILDQFKSATKIHEVKPVLVDVVSVCERAIKFASERADVSVSTYPENSVIRALVDPVRIEEILDELIRNSIEVVGNNLPLRIEIEIRKVKNKDLPDILSTGNKYILIRFTDNGPGVPINNKEAIFLPFHTSNPHGSGLGLAIVSRILEAHHGLIREVGTPNEGAKFEMFLPYELANSDNGKSEELK